MSHVTSKHRKGNTLEYNSIGANQLASWYAEVSAEICRAGHDEQQMREHQGEAIFRALLLIADKIHGTAKS